MTAAAAVVISTVFAILNGRCLDLVVASSNEKFQLLAEIAKNYSATVDRRCVTVQIIQKASGAAERSLRRDWRDEPSNLPRPHVWLPAATTWLVLLSQHRADDGLPELLPPVAQPIMQSPLVIAMPQQMADVLHQRIGPRIGWEHVFELAQEGWARYEKPSWGPFKLGKTNPTTSTSGLHALISVNYAAESPDAPEEFLKTIESSVVHYADSVGTLLSNLYAADRAGAGLQYVSAVAVEEKQAFDYNRGNPRSDLCRPVCLTPPKDKLVAVYPAGGTLIADHPYAILEWTDSARREAALDFERYLESPTVQKLFQAEGFRNYRGEAGTVLAAPFFSPSGPKARWLPPDPPKLVEMLGLWSRDFRKPAHALFVLDVGRSMLDSVAGGRETKLDVAIRASSDAFAELAPHDGIGLWTFPTSDGSPYREVSPPTTLAPDTAGLIRVQTGLRTSSDEASFYAAVHASVDRVRSSYVRGRINAVVVLTGGGYALNDKKAYGDLIAYLQGQSEEERVRVFMISYNSPSRDVLKQIAESSGGVLYEVTDQVNIGDALRNAMSNF